MDSVASITKYISRSMLEVVMEENNKKHLQQISTVEGVQATTRKVYLQLSKDCKTYNDRLKIMILNESKTGGRFDYFTPIKGHEMEGIAVKRDLITTRLGMALYQWGRANRESGVQTVEDTLSLWTQLNGRNADERERNYITLGFNKGLEE